MSNKFQISGQSLFQRKKTKIQQKMQEIQIQKKQSRIFQAIFQSNLSKFIKKNKDCFNGGIEIPANRIIFTSEQILSNKPIIDNFEKYSQRLIKGMLLRNQPLVKQQCSYQNQYHNIFALNESQQQRINKHTNPQQNPQFQPSAIQYNSQKTQQTTTKRPFSASITLQGSSRLLSVRKNNQRPSSSMNREARNTVELKSVQINNVDFRRKVPLFRQSLVDIYQYQKYQEEQVYIRRKIVCHPQSTKYGHYQPQSTKHDYYQPQTTKNEYRPQTTKNDYQPQTTKNDFQSKNDNKFTKSSILGQRKVQKSNIFKKYTKPTINYANEYQNLIQKQKLQNKIMMVNSVLAFNLSQNQNHGYKAKSKCWSNPII